ncbi:MAG: DUF4434 domain-containing protein [Clostridia bacterium]|nr:DUF4434 domain-containing protein [Clostridia bacterium]
MKKTVSLLIIAALTAALLCACTASPADSPDGEQTGAESEISADSAPEDISSAPSAPADESGPADESEPSAVEKDWPVLSGTFIQPYLLESFSDKKMQKHCDYLLEAGIDTIILQWSLADKDGAVTGAFYPCGLGDNGKIYSSVADRLLKTCEAKGMKVVMGLNNPDTWFSKVLEDVEWYEREADLGVRAAREIYALYKEKYPNALYAWYFTPEYYSGMGKNDRAADFLNLYIDPLNELDPTMPVYFSPFLKSSVTPAETERQWTEIFSLTHFRPGDVFMPQDSVGAGGIQLSELDTYFAALKRAVDTCPDLVFMANNECFTGSYKAASFDRVAKQIIISGKYVSGNVTFAYSHYVSPDVVGNSVLHGEYVRYFETGEYDEPETEPRLSYDGPKTMVSLGKPYTGAVSSRGDGWDDDGVKLTDGDIPGCSGNTHAYFGASCKGAEIIIDLGEATENISEFALYTCFGSWGINSPDSVTYYVSEDGETWTPAGDTVYSYTLEFAEKTDEWSLYDFKLVSSAPLRGRYVKASVDCNGWLWISEFAVYTYDAEES